MLKHNCHLAGKLTALCLSAALLLQPVLAAGPALPQNWKNPFTDVPDGEWFTPYIANLYANGIIKGYDAHTFGPRDRAYTDQATLMIVKAAGSGALEVAAGRYWAEPYAQYALERSWYTTEDYPSDLKAPATRLSVARLAARALNLPILQEAPSPFADVDDPYVTALYKADIMNGVQQGEVLNFLPENNLTRGEMSTVVWKMMEYRKHIHYNNNVLDILPGVAASPYDRDLFRLEGDRMTYTGQEVTPVLGVDVSHNQGSIDWNRVAGDGIEFALIRVGGRGYGVDTGVIYEDRNFLQNVTGARNAGLAVGVYFFSQAVSVEEAEEEARFVLEQLQGRDVKGPVVFDWENVDYDEARTDNVDRETLTAMADAFCREVEAAGYQAMIYANREAAYLKYDLTRLAQHPFWIAEYSTEPSFYYSYAVWQYTDRGRVDGIDGNVDLNLWMNPTR